MGFICFYEAFTVHRGQNPSCRVFPEMSAYLSNNPRLLHEVISPGLIILGSQMQHFGLDSTGPPASYRLFPVTSDLLVLILMEQEHLEELGRSCVSQGEARTSDTSHARHRPLFPLPQPLSRVFTSIFLPLTPDSEYSAPQIRPPLQPTAHPVTDTCQPSRPHRSAEPGSGFPPLNAPNEPFPSAAKCQAPTKVTQQSGCLDLVGSNAQTGSILIRTSGDATKYPTAVSRWSPHYSCMGGFSLTSVAFGSAQEAERDARSYRGCTFDSEAKRRNTSSCFNVVDGK